VNKKKEVVLRNFIIKTTMVMIKVVRTDQIKNNTRTGRIKNNIRTDKIKMVVISKKAIMDSSRIEIEENNSTRNKTKIAIKNRIRMKTRITVGKIKMIITVGKIKMVTTVGKIKMTITVGKTKMAIRKTLREK